MTARYVTQAEIANMLGYSPAYINQMKSRGQIPDEFFKMVKDKVGGRMRQRISTDFVEWHKENRTKGKAGPKPGVHQSDLSVEKQKAELAKLILQSKKLQVELEEKQGLYALKSDFESMLAERAGIFRQDLESMARAKSADIVSIAGGDPEKVPAVIDYILKLIHKFLGRYCG